MSEFKEEWIVKHSESNTAFNIVNTELGGKYKIARVPYLVVEELPEISKRNKKEAERHANIIVSSSHMLKALEKIVEMNRQHAEDEYGDPEKAESWSCVQVAREAINKALS